jgi:hypothetical protein
MTQLVRSNANERAAALPIFSPAAQRFQRGLKSG